MNTNNLPADLLSISATRRQAIETVEHCLKTELSLIATFVELSNAWCQRGRQHESEQIRARAEQGLATIRRFISGAELLNRFFKASIARRCDELEQELYQRQPKKELSGKSSGKTTDLHRLRIPVPAEAVLASPAKGPDRKSPQSRLPETAEAMRSFIETELSVVAAFIYLARDCYQRGNTRAGEHVKSEAERGLQILRPMIWTYNPRSRVSKAAFARRCDELERELLMIKL